MLSGIIAETTEFPLQLIGSVAGVSTARGGSDDDKSLAQLLHYLQFQEVATRNFQAYMNEMETRCRNIAKEVESLIKEAEKVVE